MVLASLSCKVSAKLLASNIRFSVHAVLNTAGLSPDLFLFSWLKTEEFNYESFWLG